MRSRVATHMLLLHVLSDRLTGALFIILEIVVVLDADPAVTVLLAFLARQAAVSGANDPLVLLPEHVRLQAQHPRHTDERNKQQHNLNKALTGVQLRALIDRSGREEHVDQHVEQSGGRRGGLGPVDRPLVDDANDEVAEDGPHEEDLRDELGVNVERLLEVDVVRDLETDGEGHLRVSRRKR